MNLYESYIYRLIYDVIINVVAGVNDNLGLSKVGLSCW